jgi:hypothetical protein
MKKLVTATAKIEWVSGSPVPNQFERQFTLSEAGKQVFGDEADITQLFKSPEGITGPFKVVLWVHAGAPNETPQTEAHEHIDHWNPELVRKSIRESEDDIRRTIAEAMDVAPYRDNMHNAFHLALKVNLLSDQLRQMANLTPD